MTAKYFRDNLGSGFVRRCCLKGFACGIALGCASAFAATNSPSAIAWDTFSDTWVATDDLGRSLPSPAEAGAPRAGKFVGIFYFLWREGNSPVYDLSARLKNRNESMFMRVCGA